MAQKSVKNSAELGKEIRERRLALGLTLEGAAALAGVGTKTWCRYESGEAIRADKIKGIRKTLHWRDFLPLDDEQEMPAEKEDSDNNPNLSDFIEETYGYPAAVSFAVGCDMLGDYIRRDLAALRRLPKGSHLGQLSFSALLDELPEQFVTRYDYEFVYGLKCSLRYLRESVLQNRVLLAHSVTEELVLYLITQVSSYLPAEGPYSDDWIYDAFAERDVIAVLYAEKYVPEDHSYHFDRWMDEQFFTDY